MFFAEMVHVCMTYVWIDAKSLKWIYMKTGRRWRTRWRTAGTAHNIRVLIDQIA